MRALLLLALLAPQETLEDLRRSIREKRAEVDRLLKASHTALDRTEYEKAVRYHREARRLESEAAEAARRERAMVETLAGAMVAELGSDDVDTRDRASVRLVALGPGAVPVLEKAAGGTVAKEVQARLSDIIAVLRSMEEDEEGRVRQWATDARASTQYTADAWSAQKATGKPDTPAAGDNQAAWASLDADGGEEWLELTYRHWVRASIVRIHETYNPGAVEKIEAQDVDGAWHVLWAGKERTEEKIRWFERRVEKTPFATRKLRLTLNSAAVAGWNEIDAVELLGEIVYPPPSR